MTVGTVVDGKMNNEQLGALTRRQSEITRRVNEGTLTFEGVMNALQNIIEGCFQPVWSVLKTIKLGTGPKSADDFRKSLEKANCGIADWGNDILGQPAFKVSETEMDVDIVIVSVADLGFKNGARYVDICQRAIELGLMLCPAEVGPQLRLQYTDQPEGDLLMIAMEAIAGSDGRLFVFNVKRCAGGKLWLSASYGQPDVLRHANHRFVFLRRK